MSLAAVSDAFVELIEAERTQRSLLGQCNARRRRESAGRPSAQVLQKGEVVLRVFDVGVLGDDSKRQSTTLSTAIAAALLTTGLASFAATQPFTAATAPDAASARILRHPLATIVGDTPAGTDAAYAIHTHFGQVVEQNFARLDAGATRILLDNLSEKELSDLAQLYVSSNADTGHSGELLAVLSTRLDTARLTRLSRHFGYSPVYSALSAISPQAASAFSMSANPMSQSPVPHANTVGSLRVQAAVFAGGGATMRPMAGGLGSYFNLSPYETYLAMRTSPVGALGVRGALLETTFVFGRNVYVSWVVGTKIGDALNPVLETYAPGFYDALGGTLDAMYGQYRTAVDQIQAGQIQSAFGSLFGTTFQQTIDFGNFGGDYQATMDWTAYKLADKKNGCTVCQSPTPTGD